MEVAGCHPADANNKPQTAPHENKNMDVWRAWDRVHASWRTMPGPRTTHTAAKGHWPWPGKRGGGPWHVCTYTYIYTNIYVYTNNLNQLEHDELYRKGYGMLTPIQDPTFNWLIHAKNLKLYLAGSEFWDTTNEKNCWCLISKWMVPIHGVISFQEPCQFVGSVPKLAFNHIPSHSLCMKPWGFTQGTKESTLSSRADFQIPSVPILLLLVATRPCASLDNHCFLAVLQDCSWSIGFPQLSCIGKGKRPFSSWPSLEKRNILPAAIVIFTTHCPVLAVVLWTCRVPYLYSTWCPRLQDTKS